ncbi:hypothetical protein [Roseiflexus sp.]|uniref:hypothetical protein n=1 Tax=Roseiflexus sp. TaxID=2562120 RepID=UPI00398B184E
MQSVAGASQVFVSIADALEALANQPIPLDDYAVAWRHATAACEPVTDALARDLACVRSDRLAGVLDDAQYAILESHLLLNVLRKRDCIMNGNRRFGYVLHPL